MTDHDDIPTPARLTGQPTSPSSAFEARVAELERLAADARRELTEWQVASGALPATPATPVGTAAPGVASTARNTTSSDATPPLVARRRALQALGGAAVAGAATVLATQPAAAVDGDAVTIGDTKSAQSTTGIVATTTMSPVLHVRATNTAFDQYNGAIQGSSGESAGRGVIGLATATNGVGTIGLSEGDLGIGLAGVATGPRGRGASFDGAQANIRLNPAGTGPIGRSNVSVGDVVCNSAGELWICVDTVPTVWRLMAGPTTANAIRLVTPYRAYDSRPGQPPLSGTKAKLNQGQERDVSLASGGNPPAGSTGALVNLTATNTSASGWLSIFKDGIVWPGTTTVNWSQAGTTIANFAIVAMTSAGGVTVRAAGSADVIIDVIGFV